MKQGILLCLLLLLVCLCSCQGESAGTEQSLPPLLTEEEKIPTETPPSLPFSPLPPRSEESLWINGRECPLYGGENGFWFPGEAAAQSLEGSLLTEDCRSCRLVLPQGEWELFPEEGSCLFTKEEGFLLPLTLLEEAGLHPYEEGGRKLFTSYPTGEELPEKVTVPVLMYHAVSDDLWDIPALFVSPANMEAQLQYLRDNGYTTLHFQDLPLADQVEKPILLTFDDGFENNYTELFPLLKKYNAKATVFITTGNLTRKLFLNADQIREMDESGLVSFQSHTVSHLHLDGLTEEQLRKEFSDSKAALSRITGKEPFVLCYPYGSNSPLSLRLAEEYYSFGLLMADARLYNTSDNPYRIMREYISRSTTLKQFAAMLEH